MGPCSGGLIVQGAVVVGGDAAGGAIAGIAVESEEEGGGLTPVEVARPPAGQDVDEAAELSGKLALVGVQQPGQAHLAHRATGQFGAEGALSRALEGGHGCGQHGPRPVDCGARIMGRDQVAAMILRRTGTAAPNTADPAWWRQALFDLAGDQVSAWCLIETELSLPAFLQPPVPERHLNALKNTAISADGLDLPVTARNHDRKLALAGTATPAQWVFALISGQTFQGYSGRGNYGIARMNGGFGNRPGVATAPADRPGLRFRRDLTICLDTYEDARERCAFAEEGVPLLWCLPWDGTRPLPWRACDPLAIEVARRIRLITENGRILARYGTSDQARVSGAEPFAGDVGDPWTPVADDGKSLTLGGDGFTYKKLADLLLSGFRPPPGPGRRARDAAGGPGDRRSRRRHHCR